MEKLLETVSKGLLSVKEALQWGEMDIARERLDRLIIFTNKLGVENEISTNCKDHNKE